MVLIVVLHVVLVNSEAQQTVESEEGRIHCEIDIEYIIQVAGFITCHSWYVNLGVD